jgi:uncharacterized protein (UPF0548 family)
VIVASRPDAAFLAALVERLSDQEVTYGTVGATKAVELPAGYHHERASVHVGRGGSDWEKAQDALVQWKGHAKAGLTVLPSSAPLSPGTVIAAIKRLGPVFVVAPCRVIYRTDEIGRFGFAYGTLPGHPESGEEAFHVTRGSDDTVRFEIVAFYRPLEVLGGPVSRAIQATTRSYLRGVQVFVMGTK